MVFCGLWSTGGRDRRGGGGNSFAFLAQALSFCSLGPSPAPVGREGVGIPSTGAGPCGSLSSTTGMVSVDPERGSGQCAPISQLGRLMPTEARVLRRPLGDPSASPSMPWWPPPKCVLLNSLLIIFCCAKLCGADRFLGMVPLGLGE